MQKANFRVVLDACVLANATVCDLFLRLAEQPRCYLPLWSAQILDEVHRTQTTKLPKLWPVALADLWRQQVTQAFPEANITGYEPLLPVMTNQVKDRHVLAAAVMAHAQLIVTFNLKDFPLESTQPWNVEVKHPQDYLLVVYSMDPMGVVLRLATMAQNRGIELPELLKRMAKSVPKFSEHMLST